MKYHCTGREGKSSVNRETWETVFDYLKSIISLTSFCFHWFFSIFLLYFYYQFTCSLLRFDNNGPMCHKIKHAILFIHRK